MENRAINIIFVTIVSNVLSWATWSIQLSNFREFQFVIVVSCGTLRKHFCMPSNILTISSYQVMSKLITNVIKNVRSKYYELTCSFLSFLSGLRDWRGESSSGICSGGCDIVCRLLASLSRSFSSARAVRMKMDFFSCNFHNNHCRLGFSLNWVYQCCTYHPCFGCSNVYQWDYVRIVALDDRLASSSFGTWCVPNNGIWNPILETNSTQPFPVSSNGKRCDVRRMLSTIFSLHDGWPIWNQWSIRIARIHRDEFLCRSYVACTISSEFSAMQSDWCVVCAST